MILAAPGLAVAVINFNTTAQTLRCIESLREQSGIYRIAVLDNASAATEYEALALAVGGQSDGVTLLRSDVNLGFAGGCNLLLDSLLRDPCVDQVLLFNNDAVALPGMVNALASASAQYPQAGLVGGRVHRLASPDQPDSLGIALYSSLMASNRKTTEDPYLGPTGGCCLLSRAFIEDIQAAMGMVFDVSYFCYWEDTDLVLRAILLGYAPVYTDQLIALHEGQASSGGKFNEFVAYHGLRNAIWTFVKCMPAALIIRYGLLFVLANLMSVARFLVAGQWRLAVRIYRDAFRGLPACWQSRQRVMSARRAPVAQLKARISNKFYESGYIREAAKRLFSGLFARSS